MKRNKYWLILTLVIVCVIIIIITAILLFNFEKPQANAIVELRDVLNEKHE